MDQRIKGGRLYVDPILFTLSTTSLEGCTHALRRFVSCSRTTMIDYSSWVTLGAPLVHLILEAEKFDNVILDTRFWGTDNEFERVIAGLYSNWGGLSLTVIPSHPDQCQRFFDLNVCHANRSGKPRHYLLLDADVLIWRRGDSELDPYLPQLKWFDGIILTDRLADKYYDKIPDTTVIARASRPMYDLLSADTSDKSYIVSTLRRYPHLLFTSDQTIRASDVAFDLLYNLLMINKLL